MYTDVVAYTGIVGGTISLHHLALFVYQELQTKKIKVINAGSVRQLNIQLLKPAFRNKKFCFFPSYLSEVPFNVTVGRIENFLLQRNL